MSSPIIICFFSCSYMTFYLAFWSDNDKLLMLELGMLQENNFPCLSLAVDVWVITIFRWKIAEKFDFVAYNLQVIIYNNHRTMAIYLHVIQKNAYAFSNQNLSIWASCGMWKHFCSYIPSYEEKGRKNKIIYFYHPIFDMQ